MLRGRIAATRSLSEAPLAAAFFRTRAGRAQRKILRLPVSRSNHAAHDAAHDIDDGRARSLRFSG
jgi:hypothetical protein